MKKLISEWTELAAFVGPLSRCFGADPEDPGTFVQGTILLNANVAFLAIQSVDVNSPTRSSAQIASYSSTIASIGSIAIGLLLIRRVRSREVRSDMVRLSNRI